MESLQNSEGYLYYTRANVLMALYDEAVGWRRKSLDFAAKAGKSLEHLAQTHTLSVLKDDSRESVRPRRTISSSPYWTYFMMTRFGSNPLVLSAVS